MGLSDLNFLFRFLPVFLLLYFLCPIKYRNTVLFGASVIFCALSSLQGAAVLLVSVTVNYGLLRAMNFSQNSAWRRDGLP